jgi:hypothetical protein
VQLLSAPGCPLVERARSALHRALTRAGITAAVEELVGAYPSPAILINGRDVVTGGLPTPEACCRLDLPTTAQIAAALEKG